MSRRRSAIIACIISASSLAALAQEYKSPPKTRTDNVTETIHGVTVTDPYRWLEDQNSAETRAWITAQNEHTQSIIGALPGRGRIRERLTQLLKVDAVTAPFERGGRYFYTKRRADQNQPVYYLRRGLSGKEEVLLDPNTMSPDQTTSIRLLDVTPDGKRLAYGVQQGGEDEITVSILDVETGKELPDHLPRGRLGVSLKPDMSGFFYSRFTNSVGPRVYYHAIGTNTAGDQEIFGKGFGPQNFITESVTDDGRYLQLSVSLSRDKTDIYVQDLANKGPIAPIVKDIDAAFSGQIAGDQLFLSTNWQAPNRRILAVDLKHPARELWREVTPETTSVIDGFSLAGGKIFVSYLENVRSRVKVFDPSGKHVRDIAFPTLGRASGLSGNWERDDAFYTFSSFAQPPTIYHYHVSSGKQEVWARNNVPVKADEIGVKQVWFQSKDSTRIPMFLVHRKGIKLDGKRPALLTGYGGFNISLMPGFSATAAYWAEVGGVYAVANLRGGGELGEKWHKAGMLENKQKVFDDFIGAAEWLIENGYTNPSKLAISGSSNGGLLAGAAMTQRPELFRAVLCLYPLLDMVRYQNFLVARFWVPEYGSSEDPNQFPYIYKYSPYHNVKKGVKYPAVLFVTGDSDTRVAPLHARKMAALVQASTGSDRPVLLHYDTKSGHAGGAPVSKQIEDETGELSFLFWQLGVK